MTYCLDAVQLRDLMMPPEDLLHHFPSPELPLAGPDDQAACCQQKEEHPYAPYKKVDRPVIGRVAVPVLSAEVLTESRMHATLSTLHDPYVL